MDESLNTRIVKNIYADFARKDIKAILDVLDEKIDWTVKVNWPGGPRPVPYEGRYTGREEVATCFARLLETIEPQELANPTSLVVQGAHVMASGEDLRRVRSTGTMIENRWSMLFTMRGGKVVRFYLYEDTIERMDD